MLTTRQACHFSCMSVHTSIQQVEFVAAMFGLDAAAPLWLVKQLGNVAVAPRGGKFAGPLVTPGATYDVRGKGTGKQQNPPAAVPFGGKGPASPFGAYCTPTTSYTTSQRPLMSKIQKGIWRKTIIVVSLTKKGTGSSKTNPHVDYKVVTQVFVKLDETKCTIKAVAEMVKEQLSFDVVLLDSKCFPLLDNDSTKGVEFWKSTRKVLAANRLTYTKLTGRSSPEKPTIDLTEGDSDSSSGSSVLPMHPPSPKKPRVELCKCSSVLTKLNEVAKGVEAVQRVTNFLSNLQQAFNCVICRDVCTEPVVAPCCERVIGCQSCVDAWLGSHESCPHCTCTTGITSRFVLRGMGDVIICLKSSVASKEEPHSVPSPPLVHTSSDYSDNSDLEDLPHLPGISN